MKSSLGFAYVLALFAILLPACDTSDKQIDESSWHENTQKQKPTTPEAQFRLGLTYAEGEGVPQDPAKAERWWKKAALQGHPDAQLLLLGSYSTGAFGIKKSVLQQNLCGF
jgi:TPR repeat protein